jgi:hypothetical protein
MTSPQRATPRMAMLFAALWSAAVAIMSRGRYSITIAGGRDIDDS